MSLIVVIEDNAQTARLAEKLLTRAGYTVELAEDGELGLTKVFNKQPDLVLIDLGLPDIDGQTVVSLLRQRSNYDHMPIIAFTAWPQDTAHSMAEAYGCDGVITKPIDTRAFAGQIAEYLATVEE
jgi:CheY-like chemotaxis protein